MCIVSWLAAPRGIYFGKILKKKKLIGVKIQPCILYKQPELELGFCVCMSMLQHITFP